MTRKGHVRLANALNVRLDGLVRLSAWLVLPLSALLFLQWPLRDLVGAGSRPANDLAQWVFALYVAMALRAATRDGAHLALGHNGDRVPSARRRALLRWTLALCVLPWAMFVLISAAPGVWQSVRNLESFPDTQNPLYFVIKFSVWWMAVLMAVQALLDGLADTPNERPDTAG